MRWWVGLALVLAACYGPSYVVGGPCASNGSCPTGQYCDYKMTPPTCVAGEPPPVDAAPDAPMMCATNPECDAAAPICDPSSLTCRGCVADSECGSDICLEYIGQCHNASNTLFVSPGAPGSSCTRTAPCTFPTALGQVANNRRVIAVADGTYTSQFHVLSTFNANSLTVSGTDRDPAGAVVTPTAAGAAGMAVDSSAKELIVEGITFANSTGFGIQNFGTLTLSRIASTGNAQDGINANGAQALHVLDSRIANNSGQGIDLNAVVAPVEILRCVVSANLLGGIDVAVASATIESTIIAANGSTTSNFGAVRFQGANAIVFAFNTVAANLAQSGMSGVQCESGMTLDSSILIDPDNGQCAPTYSLFLSQVPVGGANIGGDPMFVSPTTGNYHVMATSPVRDAANPAATTTSDVDGESRPVGGARDIGADELP